MIKTTNTEITVSRSSENDEIKSRLKSACISVQLNIIVSNHWTYRSSYVLMHEPWNSPPVVSLANSEIQRSYSGDNGAMTPPLIELQMKHWMKVTKKISKNFQTWFKLWNKWEPNLMIVTPYSYNGMEQIEHNAYKQQKIESSQR